MVSMIRRSLKPTRPPKQRQEDGEYSRSDCSRHLPQSRPKLDRQLRPLTILLDRFLLKYVSRDEVEVQRHGKGGIVELREAIKQYTEISPLFGYIRYRRRNVLIKYVPEDVSRLVQGKRDGFRMKYLRC